MRESDRRRDEERTTGARFALAASRIAHDIPTASLAQRDLDSILCRWIGRNQVGVTWAIYGDVVHTKVKYSDLDDFVEAKQVFPSEQLIAQLMLVLG